jgi:hypothetical protein
MINVSAAMGSQFAAILTEMHARIKALGLNPLRQDTTLPAITKSEKGELME